jgi:TonB family protein
MNTTAILARFSSLVAAAGITATLAVADAHAQVLAAAVTVAEAPAGASVPRLMNPDAVGRNASSRYGSFVELAAPRQAEFLVQIDERGRVKEARLITSSGSRVADRVFAESVREMRFTPATVAGQAVSAWITLPMYLTRN